MIKKSTQLRRALLPAIIALAFAVVITSTIMKISGVNSNLFFFFVTLGFYFILAFKLQKPIHKMLGWEFGGGLKNESL